MKQNIQLDLFARTAEKGSAEWGAFNSVRESSIGMFRVAAPQKPAIRYSNIVPIRRFRYPQPLFPKGA